MSFTPTNFESGQRVACRTLSTPQATFLEYGPANTACSPNHVSCVSYPGMRIAYVDSDKYGRIPIWEKDLVAL